MKPIGISGIATGVGVGWVNFPSPTSDRAPPEIDAAPRRVPVGKEWVRFTRFALTFYSSPTRQRSPRVSRS